MRGSSIGELNVYSQTKGGGLRKLWSKAGEQGSTWQLAQVSLFEDSNYEVRKWIKERKKWKKGGENEKEMDGIKKESKNGRREEVEEKAGMVFLAEI